MLRPSLLILLLACTQFCFGFQSSKFDWGLVYPELSGSRLTAAAWGDSGWVVPSNNIVLVSEDGHDWEVVNSPWPISKKLYADDICFGAGKYVVVCDTGNDFDSDGYLFWSTDGRTWNLSYTALDERVLSVAYAEGKFVAIGAGGLTIESTDGINWTELTPAVENLPLGELAYLNGQWWAWYPTFGDGVYRSTNLTTWELSLPFSVSALCYGDEGYVAVGREQRPWPSTISDLFIYHSVDGINWTEVNDEGISAYLTDCIFANGKYYVVSFDEGLMWVSGNGRDWVEASIPSQKYGYNAIESNPAGQLLAVGGFGNIAVSNDGDTWTNINTEARIWLYHVSHLNGRFIALGGENSYGEDTVGSAIILSSADGREWSAFVPPEQTGILSRVAYGNGRWVVTGRDGGIFVSTDGVTWSDHSLSDKTVNLTQVIFHNGAFLAYPGYPNAGEYAYRSTDGIEWATVDLVGTTGIRSISQRNGQYISFDGTGSILVSDNGIDWVSKDVGFSSSVSYVLYEKERYVFFGNGITDTIHVTRDLESWETITVPEVYHHISYRNGWFFLRDSNWNISWVSRDVRHWKELKDVPSIDSSFNLTGNFDLSADSDTATVKFGNMDLYVSDLDNPNTDLTVEVMDTREPECFGHAGKSYQLEGSNDFTNWFPVGAAKQGSGKFLVWSPIDPAGPYSYYRIAEQ